MSTVKVSKYNEFVRAYARKCRRDNKKFLISDAARLWSRLEGGSWANLFNPAKAPSQADYDKAMDNYAEMQKYYGDRKAIADENKASLDAIAKDNAKYNAEAALYRAQHPEYNGAKGLVLTKMSQHAPPPTETTYNAVKNSITSAPIGSQPKASSIFQSKPASSIFQTKPSSASQEKPSSSTSQEKPAGSLFHTMRQEPSRLSALLTYNSRHDSEPQKPKSECDAKCKKWLLNNYNHLTGHHHFRDTKSFVNHLLKE